MTIETPPAETEEAPAAPEPEPVPAPEPTDEPLAPDEGPPPEH